MNLIISLLLVCTLFSTGYPIVCFVCTSEDGPCVQTQNCASGDVCASSTTTSYRGGTLENNGSSRSCVKPQKCVSHSVNFGRTRKVEHTECCDTDLCNSANSTELQTKNSPNGRKCFICNREDCRETIECLGDEDNCINIKVTSYGHKRVVKGCASSASCKGGAALDLQIPDTDVSLSCCGGNFCNDAQQHTHSILILLVPLASIILH